MTDIEAGEIMDILELAYPNYYKNQTNEKRLKSADLWSVCLVDDKFEDIRAGLFEFIKTDKSGFPPAIGQLRGISEDYRNKQKREAFFTTLVQKSLGFTRELENNRVAGLIEGSHK